MLMRMIMFFPRCSLVLLGFLGWSVASLLAKAQVNVADDDANQGMYSGGWNQGSGGDNGFFAWRMVAKSDGEESFAGHYLANQNDHGVISVISDNRAFALFANGCGFEESVAFRGIAVPLEPGDNFSFDILHGPFEQKGDSDDPNPGEVGVSYRHGNADQSVEDADQGVRLRFFAREGAANYLVTDAESEFDTGIPITWEAVSLTVTMVDADTYDLEVINLRDQTAQLFQGRKFGGEPGAPIQSLAFFNRNSETHDFFFNNFQLSRDVP